MKKYKFRLQVVLDLREKELEARRMELAKILTTLNFQEEKLQEILNHQKLNNEQLENSYFLSELNVQNVESYRLFGIKLLEDEKNQNRIIANTKSILKIKQNEVHEAYKKVEILKKLKNKEEKEYYQQYLQKEAKEIDDMTTSRFKKEAQ